DCACLEHCFPTWIDCPANPGANFQIGREACRYRLDEKAAVNALALKTLRAVPGRPAVAKRRDCACLEHRFPTWIDCPANPGANFRERENDSLSGLAEKAAVNAPALQTLRAVPGRPAVANRRDCACLEHRFPTWIDCPANPGANF